MNLIKSLDAHQQVSTTASLPAFLIGWSLFPLISQGLRAHTTFYQSEFGTMCMKYVQKTFLEGTFMCAQSFLVCTRLTACVCAHSLKGTLIPTIIKWKTLGILQAIRYNTYNC